MKQLMENWKRFLKENEIQERDGLAIINKHDRVLLVLYNPIPTVKPPKVYGMIRLEEPGFEPCIPPTLEIALAALDDTYRGKGYGKKLYDLAATFAASKGAGITSDHMGSTSDDAKAVWDKIEADGSYQKKKTPGSPPKGGHDKFDYTGQETPEDPNDNCDLPMKGKPATDHSFVLTSPDSDFGRLVRGHENYVSFKGHGSKFDEWLWKQADDLFQEAYANATIYDGDE